MASEERKLEEDLQLINGVPVAQIELKTLGINARRAIEQTVEYKLDPGNGYTRTLSGFAAFGSGN